MSANLLILKKFSLKSESILIKAILSFIINLAIADAILPSAKGVGYLF